MKKVLIANRGEIAVRAIRACRDHSLQSVTVYADDDGNAQRLCMADEADALHGQRPAKTYLDIAKLIDLARKTAPKPCTPATAFCPRTSPLPKP